LQNNSKKHLLQKNAIPFFQDSFWMELMAKRSQLKWRRKIDNYRPTTWLTAEWFKKRKTVALFPSQTSRIPSCSLTL
jgi:hypothetical protein